MSTEATKVAKSIKIKELNVSMMLAYLTNADIQKPLVLEINKSQIRCKVFPVDKSWIKYTAAPIGDIMKFDTLPPDFGVLKLPFNKITPLKNMMEIFLKSGIDRVDCEIGFSDSGLVVTGDHMKFKSKSMKTTVKCTDSAFIDFMPDTAWEKVTSKEGELARFDAKEQLLYRMDKLCGLSSSSGDTTDDTAKVQYTNFLIGIKADSKELYFKSIEKDNWQILYTTDDGNSKISTENNVQLSVPKAVPGRLDGKFFDVFVIHNKAIGAYVLLAVKDEDNIVAHLMSEYKPS